MCFGNTSNHWLDRNAFFLKIAQRRLKPTPQYIAYLCGWTTILEIIEVGHANCLVRVEIARVLDLESLSLSQHGDLQPTSYEITGIMGMACGIR